MSELHISQQVRGTRLLTDDTAKRRRYILNTLATVANTAGFNEILLPLLEPASTYTDKAGDEVLSQMYTMDDKKGRKLCLRPEGTATCQLLAESVWKKRRDVRIWYATTCWRYERPQSGRYREFTQFGIEIINPRTDVSVKLITLAKNIVEMFTLEYEINTAAKRGLAYYVGDGFEISCPQLGAQKQVCGGGSYKQGYGFAFGVDRLMLV